MKRSVSTNANILFVEWTISFAQIPILQRKFSSLSYTIWYIVHCTYNRKRMEQKKSTKKPSPFWLSKRKHNGALRWVPTLSNDRFIQNRNINWTKRVSCRLYTHSEHYITTHRAYARAYWFENERKCVRVCGCVRALITLYLSNNPFHRTQLKVEANKLQTLYACHEYGTDFQRALRNHPKIYTHKLKIFAKTTHTSASEPYISTYVNNGCKTVWP